MTKLAIIGGSGLSNYPGLEIVDSQHVDTPFGEPSAAILVGRLNGADVLFLPRHGDAHTVPPHRVNYRANIYALKSLQVTSILAVAAVGGISPDCSPATLVVPDQIIDYTYGREQSFFSDDFSVDKHIDFSWPYTEALRRMIISSAEAEQLNIVHHGVYGATQGPRLETAAEIQRMRRDGCSLVGMTGMPEAVLARELDIEYATLALVANWAAGLTERPLSMQEIEENLASGMSKVQTVIAHTDALFAGAS